jgi:hypothetical protein
MKEEFPGFIQGSVKRHKTAGQRVLVFRRLPCNSYLKCNIAWLSWSRRAKMVGSLKPYLIDLL